MNKRLLAALLAVVTVATLTGCGGTKNTQKNDVEIEGGNNQVGLSNGGKQNADASNNKSGTGVDIKASGGLK